MPLAHDSHPLEAHGAMDSYLEQTLILQAQHLAAADTLQALALDASGYLTGNAAAEAELAMREGLNLNVFVLVQQIQLDMSGSVV